MNHFSNGYFFKLPYPIYSGKQNLLKLSFVLFFLTFLFSYLFEPFDVNRREHRMDYFWISLIHSVLPTLIVLAIYSMCYFTGIFTGKWSLIKELILLFFILLTIGICNFLIRDIIYDNPQNWSLHYLKEEVYNAFLVGTLFFGIIYTYNHQKRKGKHVYLESNIEFPLLKTTSDDKGDDFLFVQAHVKSDDFYLDLKNFLFAKAAGNYLELFTKTEDQYLKQLKRLPLKDLDEKLSGFQWIAKPHRSYLVNCRMVEKIQGNALGLQLSLKNFPEPVPVSRSQVESFRASLTHTED